MSLFVDFGNRSGYNELGEWFTYQVVFNSSLNSIAVLTIWHRGGGGGQERSQWSLPQQFHTEGSEPPFISVILYMGIHKMGVSAPSVGRGTFALLVVVIIIWDGAMPWSLACSWEGCILEANAMFQHPVCYALWRWTPGIIIPDCHRYSSSYTFSQAITSPLIFRPILLCLDYTVLAWPTPY